MEQPADWDRHWRVEPLDVDAPVAESRTPRWRAQERLVRERFGSFQGLRAIELGAGRGLNALLYAQRGADVTLLDESELALEQARHLFDAYGLGFTPVVADAFHPPVGAFDVSMSFGLCEHFLGDRRAAIVRAHLDVLRPGGIAFLGVPNRLAPAYRLWMGLLKTRGTWTLGTEEPFGAGELAGLARRAGGRPLEPAYGSFVGSLVNHGLNQALFKLGRDGLRVPQTRLPLLDRLAYELLLPVERPA